MKIGGIVTLHFTKFGSLDFDTVWGLMPEIWDLGLGFQSC